MGRNGIKQREKDINWQKRKKKNRNGLKRSKRDRNGQKQTKTDLLTELVYGLNQLLRSLVSSSPTVKIGRSVNIMLYCDRLWYATCNIFGFLDLSISYVKNTTSWTSLAFQMSMQEKLEKVNLLQNQHFKNWRALKKNSLLFHKKFSFNQTFLLSTHSIK